MSVKKVKIVFYLFIYLFNIYLFTEHFYLQDENKLKTIISIDLTVYSDFNTQILNNYMLTVIYKLYYNY